MSHGRARLSWLGGMEAHAPRRLSVSAFSWLGGPLLLMACMATPSLAAATDPVLPLPPADKQVIDQSLGRGVVGKPVPAPVIADPAHYLAFAPGAWTYQVRKGAHGKSTELYQWSADGHGPHGPSWRYNAGGEEIGFVEARGDGSLYLTGVREVRDDALTRYAPPEPLLLNGLAPGHEHRQRMAVRVYDPATPDEPLHEGELEVVYRYVGAYRLELPIGVHDAVLFKSTFNGHVGPATLSDVQYRFFAPGVGIVALMEKREVSAFVVYNLHLDVAKVLAGRPK